MTLTFLPADRPSECEGCPALGEGYCIIAGECERAYWEHGVKVLAERKI